MPYLLISLNFQQKFVEYPTEIRCMSHGNSIFDEFPSKNLPLTVEWGPAGVGTDFLQQRARPIRGVREAPSVRGGLGVGPRSRPRGGRSRHRTRHG